MGENPCYLPLVEIDGRLREGPVLPWPVGGDSEPPPGRTVVIESAEQAEPRLQFLETLAREDRLVLLYEPGHAAAAEAVAELLLERLRKK